VTGATVRPRSAPIRQTVSAPWITADRSAPHQPQHAVEVLIVIRYPIGGRLDPPDRTRALPQPANQRCREMPYMFARVDVVTLQHNATEAGTVIRIEFLDAAAKARLTARDRLLEKRDFAIHPRHLVFQRASTSLYDDLAGGQRDRFSNSRSPTNFE